MQVRFLLSALCQRDRVVKVLVLKTSCAKVLVGSNPTVGVTLGALRALMRDGIGKRNCHRESGEIDNLDARIAHSCVVQIHTASSGRVAPE